MHEVRIQKHILKKILADNREIHKKDYDSAMADWQKAAGEALRKALIEVEDGTWKGAVHVQRPPDHTSDYDRALRMLDLSVDDVIELDERQFDQLVRDEWDWKEMFKTVAASYKVGR